MKNIVIAIIIAALVGFGIYYLKTSAHHDGDKHSHDGGDAHSH